MKLAVFTKQKLLQSKVVWIVAAAVIFIAMGGFYLLLSSKAAGSFVSVEPENGTLAGASLVDDTTASGGKGVRFEPAPTPPPTATGALPYTLPSQTMLKASSKKVFAHYFTPYPLHITNEPSTSDYYARVYLNPDSATIFNKSATVSFPYYEMGGFLRDRPLPMPVGAAATWQLDDMKTEIRRATTAGIDGFTVDILGITGTNWDRFKLLLQAATAVDPKFKIVLMPDQNASGVEAGVTAFAAAMQSVASDPAIYKLANGNLVVAPFKAEGQVVLANGTTMTGIAYWTQFVSLMKTKYGITVALVPCFLNYQSNATAFASISYGFSNWGNRYPAGNTNIATLIADAHARGKIWMQPVSVQDSRPNQNVYWEANNTENFRKTWEGAIGGADWVQVPTWNDYSEHAHLAPSAHTGWSPLDINGYYLTKYKTGAFPAITKDVIYVSHRIQPAAALPTSTKQIRLQVNKVTSQPARDKVEVLSFMSAAGTLSVTIGGVTQSVAVPAGVSTNLFDLKPGTISARVVRGTATTASVTSPFPVVVRPYAQDLMYHIVSSARSGGIGAWNDPQY